MTDPARTAVDADTDGAGDAPPPSTGLRRMVKATIYSFSGLRAAWSQEAAFRQESTVAALLIPVGLWLGQNAVERALLLGSCLLVLIVELLNSAVEAVVDRVGTEPHLLSARAKDLGSAAVFVSLVLTFVVWALIGWQRFG
jgi:diacylglycerol kinase (ATP)